MATGVKESTQASGFTTAPDNETGAAERVAKSAIRQDLSTPPRAFGAQPIFKDGQKVSTPIPPKEDKASTS